MVFRIVSELPGRLRLRCGARLFTDEEARGVSYALMAADGVRTAEVHAANGSILLTFEPACREAVLAAVRGLDPLRLPAASDPGLGAREGALEISLENNRFQVEVTRLVLWRAAKRVLLPVPVRAALTCVRALGFVAEGLRHLLAGEVTVEVLDATAIATSTPRGALPRRAPSPSCCSSPASWRSTCRVALTWRCARAWWCARRACGPSWTARTCASAPRTSPAAWCSTWARAASFRWMAPWLRAPAR